MNNDHCFKYDHNACIVLVTHCLVPPTPATAFCVVVASVLELSDIVLRERTVDAIIPSFAG
jgi:hypothetical protein